MNSREYLAQTEYAARHYYMGLHALHSIYETGAAQYDVFQEGTPHTDADKQRLNLYLKLAAEYFSLKLSEGTMAGAIFQVAATGIRMFSANTVVPEDCRRNRLEQGGQRNSILYRQANVRPTDWAYHLRRRAINTLIGKKIPFK